MVTVATNSKLMTSRQRILTAMRREKPDHVPVIPDISNMVPCRLLGKPLMEALPNTHALQLDGAPDRVGFVKWRF